MNIIRKLAVGTVSGLLCLALPAAAAPADGAALETMSEAAFAARLDAAGQLSRGNAALQRGDYAEAFRLFRNIAVLGVPEAHYRLGLMYANGLGVRKSARQAEYWLGLAARENVPGADAALASLKAVAAGG